MAEQKTDKPQGKVIQIKTDTLVGSQYAQIVGVTVSDIDITLEFVYVHPRTGADGQKDGQVVARVTLPRSAGENLGQTIANTIIQHEAKKKGSIN